MVHLLVFIFFSTLSGIASTETAKACDGDQTAYFQEVAAVGCPVTQDWSNLND